MSLKFNDKNNLITNDKKKIINYKLNYLIIKYRNLNNKIK